jgi:hypothetical protein
MVNKNAEHTVNVYSARGWFGVTNKIENKILIGINFFVKNIKIFTLI